MAFSFVKFHLYRFWCRPDSPKSLAGVGNVLVIVLFAIGAGIWLTLAAA